MQVTLKAYALPPTGRAIVTARSRRVHRPFPRARWTDGMALDPVIGSTVLVASSAAFLAAGTAIVRLFDARDRRAEDLAS